MRVPSLEIDASVFPVLRSALPHGALGVPPLIHRLGWWQDGMAPGSSTGSTLIAGHVDSGKTRAGRITRLHEARRGDGAGDDEERPDGTYHVVSVQA